ncbi:hypothetical protein [Microbacterium aurantiacum]|uniref:hypothetical protein n=1 Tax=Microbacterium aurantiacum TaxID=162393 RepID=UPI001FE4F5E8|nr:hypothetical protein [Microbacterium aurantiacum]
MSFGGCVPGYAARARTRESDALGRKDHFSAMMAIGVALIAASVALIEFGGAH